MRMCKDSGWVCEEEAIRFLHWQHGWERIPPGGMRNLTKAPPDFVAVCYRHAEEHLVGSNYRWKEITEEEYEVLSILLA